MAHLRRQEHLQCQIDTLCKKADKMKEERPPILSGAKRRVAHAEEQALAGIREEYNKMTILIK